MCGITGYVTLEGKPELSRLEDMCDRIRHRGPDDAGYHVDDRCGLAMRRLSIIDLNTGHQPISNEDGTVWIVFNGEIYNYKDLRERLIAKGHRFSTKSDTEVILHLYEEEGTAGIGRLRGMFAFAIWDAPRRRLTLARDPFGKKPLYYSVQPGGLYFGSELKTLRIPEVPLELDHDALRLYFQLLYIPDPYTAYRSIRRLPAGSWMTFDADGTVHTERYWDFPVPVVSGGIDATEDELSEQVRTEFDRAVKARMLAADVPIGAFLSGGIDSGSVVASMALQSAAPVKTFSIGFEEAEFNELPYAALVAQRYGTDHHELVVRPDSVDLVHRLVRHFDEPFADSSAIPTFLVSQLAAEHVKVVLSGDGGDELFAGYDRFQEVGRQQWLDTVPALARAGVAGVASSLPYSAYGKNYLRMVSRPSALDRYFEATFAPYFLREAMLRPEWMQPGDEAFFRRMLPGSLPPAECNPVVQAMYFEGMVNLTSDMLVKVDRMSMANSLEVRCPLLDQDLAELAGRIPLHMKIRNGRGKYALTRALGERLPPELLKRPKMGFGVPLGDWFRRDLRDMLHDHLEGPTFAARGIVEPAFVKAMIAEHEVQRRDNSRWLWALLMLEVWFSESGAQT